MSLQTSRYSHGKIVRPRNAATLLIVRQDGSSPRVLMGQRHKGHSFMPSKFVFPGGRVDYADSRAFFSTNLLPQVRRKLIKQWRGPISENRVRSLAMAAVRETFEETGLIVGRKAKVLGYSRRKSWQAYYQTGAVPDLASLYYLARAITPPDAPRRFDTRFFLVFADNLLNGAVDNFNPSGELRHLRWVSVREAQQQDLPSITNFVLQRLEAYVALKKAERLAYKVPFVYWKHNKNFHENL